MSGKLGAICLSKELLISAGAWIVTTRSEYWAQSCSGPCQLPLQCGHTAAFVARYTFSELTELKLLSENVAWFLGSTKLQEFHFYISVVTLGFS